MYNVELVSNLRSNWGQLEPEPPSTGRVDRWVDWTESDWVNPNDNSQDNRQRLKRYPTRMPMPDGITTRANDQTSWVFRRSYTWSLTQRPEDADSWWGATARHFTSPRNEGPRNPSGWNGVLCALNTFGQDDVYRLIKSDWNAYCFRYRPTPNNGLPNTYGVSRCFVSFGASGTNTKRDNISDRGSNWDMPRKYFLPEEKTETYTSPRVLTITDIEYIEDDEEAEDSDFVAVLPGMFTS